LANAKIIGLKLESYFDTVPKDFEASKKVARQGGNVAKVALKELEARTGKKVVSELNAKTALSPKQIEPTDTKSKKD